MIFLAGVTLAMHVAGAVAYFDRSAAFIGFPAIHGYGEGPILYQLADIRAGETMYHPITDPPYAVGNYPPVFHLVTWLTTAVVGDPLAAGRLVSFLAVLASALLVFTLVYGTLTSGHSRAARLFGGVLAALFFLTHYGVTSWSTMARTDTLALALGLLGMQIFVLSIRRRSMVYLYGLAFVLAAFTKQNMIAAAIATFVTAFLYDRRQAYIAFSISVLAGLVALMVLHIASNGQFLLHAFLYNINDFQWRQIGDAVFQFVTFNPVEILLLAYGSGRLFVFWREHRQRGLLFGAWRSDPDLSLVIFVGFMAASLMNVIAFVKHGSALNYFLEFDAAGSLVLGMITVRITTCMRKSGPDAGYVARSLSVFLGLLVLCWNLGFGWDYKYSQPTRTLISQSQQVQDMAAAVDGPVISEDMVLLYKAGKPLYFQPFIMSRLAIEGRWDAAPLLDRLRHGDVRMIILLNEIGSARHQECFFSEFSKLMKTHYRLIEKTGPYLVYAPLWSKPAFPIRSIGVRI